MVCVGAIGRTTARLLPALRPHFASAFASTSALKHAASGLSEGVASQRATNESTPVASKMVDYSINLATDWAFDGAIYRACCAPVDFAPAGINTINQTLCETVQFMPAAISIETKTDRTGVADADVKLAVWMAAWRARMMPLVEKSQGTGPSHGAKCITQLGITAIGDTWKLYLLVDRGSPEEAHDEATEPRLHFLEFPKAIGNTRDVLGIYQLIAVLRHLCGWADENLRSWLRMILV